MKTTLILTAALLPTLALSQTAGRRTSQLESRPLAAGDKVIVAPEAGGNVAAQVGDDVAALQAEDGVHAEAITALQAEDEAHAAAIAANAASSSSAFSRTNHTGQDSIGDITGLQTALDAATTEDEVTTIIAEYVTSNQDALDSLKELAAILETGSLSKTLVKAIEDITTVTVSSAPLNTATYVLGAQQGVGTSPFLAWGMTAVPPAGTWNTVRIFNAGRTPAVYSETEKWVSVQVSMYDTLDLKTITFLAEVPVATGSISVDPNTDTFDEWVFNDLRDSNNDPIALTAADFPSGGVGIVYSALNSVGGQAVMGRAFGTANSLTTSNHVYTTGTTFLNDSGTTQHAIVLDYVSNDYYVDSTRDPIAELVSDIAAADAKIGVVVQSVPVPVNVIGEPGPSTNTSSTFTGWAQDMTPPTSPIGRATIYNIAQGVVAPEFQWVRMEFRLYDGSMSTNSSWPGNAVGVASVTLDPTVLAYEEIAFPRFQDPVTGDPVTLTSSDFPSGVMGAAYRATAEGGTPANAVGTAGPGENSWFVTGSYWATSSTWVATSDRSMTFEFSEPDLAHQPIPQAIPSSWNALDIPYLYSLEAKEHSVYFGNLVSDDSLTWDVSTTGSVGNHLPERFTITPSNAQAASGWTTTFSARELSNYEKVVDTLSIVTRTATADAGNLVTRTLLGIGDSTMANGVMLEELNSMFATDGMNIATVGTVTTGSVSHEAISGKTAAFFATDPTSVFFDGGLALDVPGYMTTNGFAMVAGDWVLINLGINDMFGQTSDLGASAKAAEVSADYTKLIDAFKVYEPGLRFSIGLVIPPAGDQSAFSANYGSNQTRQRYRENTFALNRELISTFGERETEGIYINPMTAGLDPLWGFDSVLQNASSRTAQQVRRWTNGVHPNADGYGQIADQLHAFLKFHQ